MVASGALVLATACETVAAPPAIIVAMPWLISAAEASALGLKRVTCQAGHPRSHGFSKLTMQSLR